MHGQPHVRFIVHSVFALEDLAGRIFSRNDVIIFQIRQYCVMYDVLLVMLPKFQVLWAIYCVWYKVTNDSTHSKEITVLHFDCSTLNIKASRSFKTTGAVEPVILIKNIEDFYIKVILNFIFEFMAGVI
jgi:hypothetical protein